MAAGSVRTVQPRRRPHQARSERRVKEILGVTARLLDRHGLNSLTTNLIAAELNISVVTLYHYFPNKHAILHATGAKWLEEWQQAFDEIELFSRTAPGIAAFVDMAIDRMLVVYQRQRGVLHLVQAMFSIPELRELDTRQDELAVTRLRGMFKRVGIDGPAAERERLARIYMKLGNSLLPEVVRQKGAAARWTLEDLKALLRTLLVRGNTHRQHGLPARGRGQRNE